MKWILKDTDVLLQAKKYVDTVFIPLLPVAYNERMKHTVEMGEYCTILTQAIENQLHGRTLLAPPFTYLHTEPIDQCLARLEEWIKELKDNHFKHVLLITSDGDWKEVESKLGHSLIWIPSIPFEHMDDNYKEEIVTDQMKQLLQIVTKKWQLES